MESSKGQRQARRETDTAKQLQSQPSGGLACTDDIIDLLKYYNLEWK